MISTKSSRTNELSKCCSTSALTVPNVLRGRCFMPSVNARRIIFEVGPRMRGGDCLNCVGGQIVTTDAQHVGLNTCSDECNFGFQEFRHGRRRVECNGKPHLA